jgi:outer membrane protein assembly factor BamB
MIRWSRGPFTIQMVNDHCYSLGSADNLHSYEHEYQLPMPPQYSVKHGIICLCEGNSDHSALLCGSGGGTDAHEHSCVLLDDRCLVAVGNRLVALALPDLTLLWERVGDDATCFGLHLTTDEQFVIVHGEMEISKFTVDGCKLWNVGGRDIFTGTCELADGVVVVTDFNDERYVIDLERGEQIG